MDTELEVYPIECPLCGHKHNYTIELMRLPIKMFRSKKRQDEIENISLTLLFHCPEKNDDFQAPITLTNLKDAPIQTVKVVSVEK